MQREAYIVKQIEVIERELQELKRFVAGGKQEMGSLRGIWKGVDITDEEIEEAKRSLFKGIEFDESG
jgi:hypothetical protein